MKIVLSGNKYLDMDGYGGCVAYAELLQLIGQDAQAILTAPFNSSVPSIVRSWDAKVVANYELKPTDKLTLIDVSNPGYLGGFIKLENVEEVIDHHPGFEAYWHSRIGDKALIEHVGSACTQVYESWCQAGLLDKISETSARLLMCGILDNTLNFGADITTERDHKAYQDLSLYANLPDDWAAKYFEAVEQEIMQDIDKAVASDIKMVSFKTYPRAIAFGQLAVWDASKAIHDALDTFKRELSAHGADWCMNVIDIAQQKSYFVADSQELKEWLSDLLDVSFKGDIAQASRSWLRKEIVKADHSKEASS